MEYNQEHLSMLLDFVRKLYNENADFADGLRRIVGTQTPSVRNAKIDKIEEYLALDYGLDRAVNPDYAFIKDEYVRNTLNSDWREMLRYRYGLRGHKVDFGEYSWHAALQIEMLVNMYYTNKYGSSDNILQALRANAINANTGKSETDYKELVPDYLSLRAKIYGLKHELHLTYSERKSLLDIVPIRNGESHRTPENKDEEIKFITNTETALKSLAATIHDAQLNA